MPVMPCSREGRKVSSGDISPKSKSLQERQCTFGFAYDGCRGCCECWLHFGCRGSTLQVTWVDRYMDHTWTTHGPHMHGPHTDHTDHTWAAHGPHMGRTWTTHGPHLDHTWAAHGPHMGRTWAAHGPHMGRTWTTRTTHGPHMEHTWTTHGPHMDHTCQHGETVHSSDGVSGVTPGFVPRWAPW